jgi:hypothetical protein
MRAIIELLVVGSVVSDMMNGHREGLSICHARYQELVVSDWFLLSMPSMAVPTPTLVKRRLRVSCQLRSPAP